MIPIRGRGTRYFIGGAATIILAAVYLFQDFDFSILTGIHLSTNERFIFNRTCRFLLNETACIMLILAVFNKIEYFRIGGIVFLAEFVGLLPLYFVLKLSLEGDSEISSPLLSQLHRMIINPLLMIVLIMALLYQDYFSKPAK